jgi:GTP pyrophosphokinase
MLRSEMVAPEAPLVRLAPVPTPSRPEAAEPSLEALAATLSAHYPGADVEPLRRATAELERAAAGPSAPGRRIYPRHALETAQVLADLRLDPPAVTAALVAPLHTELGRSAQELSESYGAEVARLCEGVARLARIRWDRIEDEAAETLRKMFVAMAQDVRVVLIVLATRVQRMRALRDLETFDDEARGVARETLDVFAPLANRLGVGQLKWELEDWSLRVLEPETFAELARLLHERREERTAYIAEVMGILRDRLTAERIGATVSGRAKHIYSIYKKMQRKQVGFDRIYDVSAVRIITERAADCYAALGLVHSLWVPLPGEFDDYVARPKDNLYQSLHTAVVGPQGRPVEVQIRTSEMHEYAELGIAAHWAYKERKKAGRDVDRKFMVLRQLMDWERELADPREFVESLKTDVFKDQVFVFTPRGDIVDLPLGATPLDFAYRIHTDVGHRCRGARVDDQIVPLDHALETGDRVEVLTHKQPSPSRDWMNPQMGFLRTASARAKVRAWFRQQGRERAVEEGRALVDKELARLELKYARIEEIAALLKYESVEDLCAAVGYGDRSPQSVASAALQIERDKAPPEEPALPPSVPPAEQRKRSASGLSLGGVDDVLGRRARCCNPVPGDAVVGFISRGRGVMIHRRDCVNVVQAAEPERIVDIEWGGGASERHPVDVEIKAQERPGMLRDLTALLSALSVDITSARVRSNKDGTASLRLSLGFQSAEQVAKVLSRIGTQGDILEVRRVAR